MLLPQKINIHTVLIVPLKKVDECISNIRVKYPNFECTYFTHQSNPKCVQLAIRKI